ncbi:MAG TPA: hypothetical protein VHE81_09480, partial [Lacipirellulaceae bacterium]|nr:hypothetical protein [Lacipirellulaceae bacterium]
MASAKSDTAVVFCPGCGAKLAVGMDMFGRRARCAGCNLAFVVPMPDSAGNAAKVKLEGTATQPPREVPQYIGFECHVCGTRMYGGPEHVGKKMKCADCGALTVVPPPPKPKKKNIPAALEGEQYELWEPDEQPLPSQLLAAQPKYIAVKCSTCDTMMYPMANQVGQKLACPDCGTKYMVPPPPKTASKPSVLAADALTPVLDPAAQPGERPVVLRPTVKMVHEEEQEAEYARAMEKARRAGKPMSVDRHGRPILPRWPLITGIIPFLFSRGVPVRWIGYSLVCMIYDAIGMYGLSSIGTGGDQFAQSMAAIMG